MLKHPNIFRLLNFAHDKQLRELFGYKGVVLQYHYYDGNSLEAKILGLTKLQMVLKESEVWCLILCLCKAGDYLE